MNWYLFAVRRTAVVALIDVLTISLGPGSSARGSWPIRGEEKGDDSGEEKGSGELGGDTGDKGGEEGGSGEDGGGPRLLSLSVSKPGRAESGASDAGVSHLSHTWGCEWNLNGIGSVFNLPRSAEIMKKVDRDDSDAKQYGASCASSSPSIGE